MIKGDRRILDRTELGGYSPEVAMDLGQEPLMPSKRHTLRCKRRELRLSRLAKQYIIDYNLPKACARADLDWKDVKDAERDPFFIQLVQELVETIDPDLVMSRQEVLMAFKKEAFHGDKSASRIKALECLARLMGMELPDPNSKDTSSLPPTINITLTQAK
jgi:hypothetical protein